MSSVKQPDLKAARVNDIASASDTLNSEIIRMLQEDGRRPFADIAQTLGVSEGTIRNRVSHLRQNGQMRIVAIVDPRAAEYKTDAMLGVKVAPNATPTQVAERLSACAEVVYVLWVSGRFDLLVEVVDRADAQLVDFLERQVHGRADIASVETMTGLRNFKNQFLLKQYWRGEE